MSILPIVTYNDERLREKTTKIEKNSESLQTLVDDMFDTMYNSQGVGLAAPQIGETIQLFVMDADAITEEISDPDEGPLVFINPEIVELKGEKVKLEEGCLSIPDVRDDVTRPDIVKVTYLDRNFESQTREFSGWVSRVIQHEYDHLEGVLFLDYISAFKRRLHRSLLRKIDNGLLETDYPLVPKKAPEIL